MKTISVEQIEEHLSKSAQSEPCEAVRLTKNADPVAWLLRLPERMKDADAVFFHEAPSGHVIIIVDAKHTSRASEREESASPVFGAGRGSLTIVSEDNEHLKDFQEHME